MTYILEYPMLEKFIKTMLKNDTRLKKMMENCKNENSMTKKYL